MSELSNSASNAAAQAEAYVASLLRALGSRDPFEVLAETPGALRLVHLAQARRIRQAIGAATAA